jgi:hypothetical protein
MSISTGSSTRKQSFDALLSCGSCLFSEFDVGRLMPVRLAPFGVFLEFRLSTLKSQLSTSPGEQQSFDALVLKLQTSAAIKYRIDNSIRTSVLLSPGNESTFSPWQNIANRNALNV